MPVCVSALESINYVHVTLILKTSCISFDMYVCFIMYIMIASYVCHDDSNKTCHDINQPMVGFNKINV